MARARLLRDLCGELRQQALQRPGPPSGADRDSYNTLATIKDSWTTANASNTLPIASYTRAFSYIDSRYVQSASYLKLRNVTVGYRLSLPKSVPVGIRLYATASNLLTVTPYKGYDPGEQRYRQRSLPSARTFTVGVNVSL